MPPIIGLPDKGPEECPRPLRAPATPPANCPTARIAHGRARTGRAHHRRGVAGCPPCGPLPTPATMRPSPRSNASAAWSAEHAPGPISRAWAALVGMGRRARGAPAASQDARRAGLPPRTGRPPGARWRTLRADAAGIAAVHRAAGQRGPCEPRGVVSATLGQAGEVGTARARAAPGGRLDGRSAGRHPGRRPASHGSYARRRESAAAAERRGRVDIALVCAALRRRAATVGSGRAHVGGYQSRAGRQRARHGPPVKD